MKTAKKWATFAICSAVTAAMLMGCGADKTVDTSDLDTDAVTENATINTPAASAPDGVKVISDDANTIQYAYGDYEFSVDKNVDIKDREIVAVFENVSIPFAQLLDSGITNAKNEYGINAYQMGGTAWDATESMDIIDSMINKGVDGLIIAAIDEDAFTKAAHKAMEAGIPVVGYNSPMTDTSARLCTVGVDVYSVAKSITDPLVKKVNDTYGGGKILLFGDLASNEPIKRAQALKDSVAEYPEGTFEILELHTTGDDAAVYADIENMMLANPDIVGAYSVNGLQYLFGKYLKSNDIGNNFGDEPIFCAGHELFEESLYNVRDGWETYLSSQDPTNQGYMPAKIFAEFYSNYDVSIFEDVTLEPIVVDKDSVEDYIKRVEAGEMVL